MHMIPENTEIDTFTKEIYQLRKQLEKVDDPADARKLFKKIRELKSLQFWQIIPSKREGGSN
ncbi:MAG: hypothetical protein ACOY46_05925 [Bacillota bacterium]